MKHKLDEPENDYDSDSAQIEYATDKLLRDLERSIKNKIKRDASKPDGQQQ